ncbi:MAG: hypothetical protein KC657_27430 [Myxococcales bacterium]|nr:hypothetical protein [Myxococcales bacterium]
MHRRLFPALALFAVVALPGSALADDDDDDPPPLPPPVAPAPAPAPAPAATVAVPQTEDSVTLRSGGFFKGKVEQIVPGSHVTILLSEGGSRRFAWNEIEKVVVASHNAPAPAAPAPAHDMKGPLARVHITAPKQVILYRRPAGTSSWVKACESPCNQELPLGDGYRVTGNGIAQSKEFNLKASPGGAVDIVVDPPATGGMVVGGIMAYGGAVGAYVGLLMTAVGLGGGSCSSSRTSYSSSSYSCQKSTATRDAGLITMGVSAAIAGAGLLIFLNSAKTDIDQRGPATNDAFVRTPTWRVATSSAESALSAPPATYPLLFQGRF